MKHWFNKNYKTFIITAFLIPILTVAVVSISHVTQWYGISNPVTWSVYLSVGIEIAALSALAAISANMGSKVYFPFIVVTLIQFIGNIFFAYSYIDINSKAFKDWVDLVSPLVEFIGVEPGDVIEITDNSKKQLRIKQALENTKERKFPSWLDIDVNNLKGTFKSNPDRSDLSLMINESLIVELYSK